MTIYPNLLIPFPWYFIDLSCKASGLLWPLRKSSVFFMLYTQWSDPNSVQYVQQVSHFKQKKRGQALNQDKLTVISSTLFLESTIVQFGKTYPPSLISARCCVIKDSLIFNTQRPRHNISSNIGFLLIQWLTPSFCQQSRFEALHF